MNIKMATSAQLSTTECKKQTKQTSKTGTESQIWRPFGGLSAGRGKGENGGNGAGINKYKLVCTKQTGDVKNTTHGHELREGLLEGMRLLGRGGQRGKNWDSCNSIINKIYFKKRKSLHHENSSTRKQVHFQYVLSRDMAPSFFKLLLGRTWASWIVSKTGCLVLHQPFLFLCL